MLCGECSASDELWGVIAMLQARWSELALQTSQKRVEARRLVATEAANAIRAGRYALVTVIMRVGMIEHGRGGQGERMGGQWVVHGWWNVFKCWMVWLYACMLHSRRLPPFPANSPYFPSSLLISQHLPPPPGSPAPPFTSHHLWRVPSFCSQMKELIAKLDKGSVASARTWLNQR